MPKTIAFCRRSIDMQGMNLEDQKVLLANWMQPAITKPLQTARDHIGRVIRTGIFIARLISPERSRSIKMVLLK